ncbi:MAG: hypothetical protein ACOH16_02455 [Propionibacteriaceae bacterium]
MPEPCVGSVQLERAVALPFLIEAARHVPEVDIQQYPLAPTAAGAAAAHRVDDAAGLRSVASTTGLGHSPTALALGTPALAQEPATASEPQSGRYGGPSMTALTPEPHCGRISAV